MIKNIIKICGLIIIAIILCKFSIYIKSDYLPDFIAKNLLTILIMLLSVNTATSSILLTKLKETSDKHHIYFSRSYKSLKDALTEQIALIVLALLTSILKGSEVIGAIFVYHDIVFNSILVALFLFSLYILWDTGQAIFIIVNTKAKSGK